MTALGEFVLLGGIGLVIVLLFAILQAIEAYRADYDEEDDAHE